MERVRQIKKLAMALLGIAVIMLTYIFMQSVSVKADQAFGYAYSYSLPETTSNLPLEEFIETINTKPLNFSGTIKSEKCLLVENGVPKVSSRPVYNPAEVTFRIYFPEITVTKYYADNAVIDDLVRFKGNSPINGHRFRTDEEIKKGTYKGLTIQLFLSKDKSVLTPSTAPAYLEVFDGTQWRDIVMPTGTQFNYTTAEDTSEVPSGESVRGVKVTLDDCCVTGYVNRRISNSRYITLHITGAKFAQHAGHKYHEVTSWFTNLPDGVQAIVADNIGEDRSTLKIIFANFNYNRLNSVSPKEECTEPIGITVPFMSIDVEKMDETLANSPGGIVLTEKTSARFDIRKMSDMAEYQDPTVMAAILPGSFKASATGDDANKLGTNGMFLTDAFVPQSIYDQLVEEQNRTGAEAPVLKLKLVPDDDIFDFEGENVVYATCTLPKSTTSAGYYSEYVYIDGEKIKTKKTGFGRFTVSWVLGESEFELPADTNYIFYDIKEWTASEDSEDHGNWTGGGLDGGEDTEDDNGNTNTTGEPVVTVKEYSLEKDDKNAPDIWVNGKDDKKLNTFGKTFTLDGKLLVSSIPSSCKAVMSITDITVVSYDNAFSNGKGLKSNIAKASYKSGKVVVTAGKTEGTARVWLGAIDKKSKVVRAVGYFDIVVGTAPKKIILTYSPSENPEANKTMTIVKSEKEDCFQTLYAYASGSELSKYSTFRWTKLKDNNLLELAPSEDTHSCVIKVKSAPSGGKAVKASVEAVCVESGKKFKCTVTIENPVSEIKGLSKEIQIESAKEAAKTKEFKIELLGSDSKQPVTDKVKVLVTSNVNAHEGWDMPEGSNKVKVTEKSKNIKASYKNGTLTIKAAKGTEDGTRAKLIFVYTGAGKDSGGMDESYIITVG